MVHCSGKQVVDWAVVGFGHDAPVAVLPALENAAHSRLAALVSGSAEKREVLTGDGTWRHRLAKRNQFAPELTHFSGCVLRGERPEPDGEEGLTDVRIVRAIHESSRWGRAVDLSLRERGARPSLELAHREPALEEPEQVQAAGPKEE